MSTRHCIVFAVVLVAVSIFFAAFFTQSEPAPFVPAVCPGCEPVPYVDAEAKP